MLGRTLITGGAGLIGSTIAEHLAAAGHTDIIVLDNFVRGRRDNLGDLVERGVVELVDGDVRDRDALRDVMSGVDVLLHQAAIRITQCALEPRLALEVLVDGTFNVLEAAAEEGVRRTVAASSASVYGMAEAFPTTERHHPYNNDTFYGAAKAFNEGMLRSYKQMHDL
ncbi:NAD-dependent epimerase/dehydratase family protein, partial [Candidatus Poribacteria bacterium]|nr:NAD-dependent epimerase/dehydratase family protein [Candidatus Poribacteria bacterium]